MEPILRSIDSNGKIVFLDDGAPATDAYSFYINARIGYGTVAADDFQILICSTVWLSSNQWFRTGEACKYLTVDGENTRDNASQAVQTYLMQCADDTWFGVVKKISEIGSWEYEGHPPI